MQGRRGCKVGEVVKQGGCKEERLQRGEVAKWREVARE